MKSLQKIFILALVGFLIMPAVSAIDISIEKKSTDEVMIAGISSPTIFDLQITNLGLDDNFQIYNLLGFDLEPKESVAIKSGETKQVDLKIYPRDNFNYRGYYNLQYFIKGGDAKSLQESLSFKIIGLEEAFNIGSEEFDPESNSINIYVENKVNFIFEKINAKFSSAFFKFDKEFSLFPNERKEFKIQLNKEDFKKLMAGFYTLNAKIVVDGKEANIEGILKFVESDLLKTSEENYGFFINTKVIEETNSGNVIAKSEVIMQKNVVSRLFTTFSPAPDLIERTGSKVQYTWNQQIKPAETLRITATTNWLFPLVLIFFIVAIVILARQYSQTNLVLRKRVNFVKAKGGEFALKISIFINARKYIEKIRIIDRLPALVKIYERFGIEKPSKVDEKNRRIEWNFEKLEAGETRILSYIIYSKIGVLGKFALPNARAIFERNGKLSESESNKAFFLSEERKEEVAEE